MLPAARMMGYTVRCVRLHVRRCEPKRCAACTAPLPLTGTQQPHKYTVPHVPLNIVGAHASRGLAGLAGRWLPALAGHTQPQRYIV